VCPRFVALEMQITHHLQGKRGGYSTKRSIYQPTPVRVLQRESDSPAQSAGTKYLQIGALELNGTSLIP
jgi:hypothetical protein